MKSYNGTMPRALFILQTMLLLE